MTAAVPTEDVQLRFRGLRIHAQVCGEGEPLLLYSGVWGEVRLWERLLPHLAGFRTIAFDPPGIGRSQRPLYPLSVWSLAQMGATVLDAFGRLRAEPQLVRSMHIRRPADTLAALYRMAGLFGWTSLPWLWAIGQPTLILAGDDDPVAPLVNHRVIASLMPQATLHTVAGGGHLVLLDSAQQIGPVITGFLQEN